MGYLSVWKVLEETIADFRKKGITIPATVMDDLKSAKTLINVLKADSCQAETAQKIEEYMLKVESFLASEGQERFGAKYVEEWLCRLDAESAKITEEEIEEARFIPGLPRDQKWIRVKPTPELTSENLKTLAKESSLSIDVQSDGYLLVYGEDARVKEFVKKIATKHGLRPEK